MGARANRHRGEIEAFLDGERRVLCLTLGALAELETAFAVDSLTGLAERFSSGRLKADDLIRIIGAGLRGGGNLFSDADVAGMAASAPVEKPAEKAAETRPAEEPKPAAEQRLPLQAGSSTELLEAVQGKAADAPLCFTCGTKMRPAGSCYVCEGCGSTSGCS